MGCWPRTEGVEEAEAAVAESADDIFEEVGGGRDTDTADGVDNVEADADAEVVASVSLDGRAEKASEEVVLIIPETTLKAGVGHVPLSSAAASDSD